MKFFLNKTIFFLIIFILFLHLNLSTVESAEVNLIENSNKNTVELFLSPQAGSFLGGSFFEVPFFVNTKDKSVTNIELNIAYDPTKLGIVKPSNGKSIIGVWTNAPMYDNNKGTAQFSGTIPGGITSQSGLVTAITFEAKTEGNAEVSILPTSKVSIFDGVELSADVNTNRGVYTIFPKPFGSVEVYSETHPLEDKWYNNTNVVFSWNKIPSVVGYSFVFDNKPNTLPENKIDFTENIKQYENLSDGIWYFHIKALRTGDIWGTTTNRKLKIDTTPPNNFKPKVEYVNHGQSNFAVITFKAVDSLSGIEHYEVGLTDTSNNTNQNISPVFNRSESPYQVSLDSIKSARVTIRAIDYAGNFTDSSINVQKSNKILQFFYNNKIAVLAFTLVFLILMYFVHYLRDHRIFKRLRMLDTLIKAEDKKLKVEEEKEEKEEEKVIESLSNTENKLI
jgi:hypothetical protein